MSLKNVFFFKIVLCTFTLKLKMLKCVKHVSTSLHWLEKKRSGTFSFLFIVFIYSFYFNSWKKSTICQINSTNDNGCVVI